MSAANGGIALGAVLGAVGISAWGIGNLGYLSALIAVTAALAVPLVAQLAPSAK